MEFETFGSLWDEFHRRILIPMNADSIQVSEMRKAFYAGGYGLLSMLMTVMSSDSEPTQEDMARMDAIHGEFVAFAQEKQWDATMAKLMERVVNGKPS